MMLLHDIVITVLVMAFATLGATAVVMWMVRNEEKQMEN